MTRFFRLLIGLPVLTSGILIGLYRLLALLYRDEGGGNTYVAASPDLYLTPARRLRFWPAALGCFLVFARELERALRRDPTSRAGANGPESRRKRATAAKPRFQP